MEFINGWYLVLIISDVLTIIASFIKIAIETKVPQFSLNTSAEFKKRRELIGGSLCSLESVVLWCLQYINGNLYADGVGGCDTILQLLSEI